MTDAPKDLPPRLRAAMDAPSVPPKSWQDGIAPAYITLFLSVVFLDRLAPTTLLVGGLAPACIGAALAGLLGYWCLFYAPAMWGASTRRPLSVVAASTFGANGSTWVPGILLGVVYILWFAVTIQIAAEYGLSGLSACGLLDSRYLATTPRGPMVVPTPLFLFVAAFWSSFAAVIGTIAVRLVAAVMAIYVIFPAIVLGVAAVWAMPTLTSGPVAAVPFGEGGGAGLGAMVQLIFGFLTCHGLTAVDWGAATRSPRDVRIGGLVGVMLGAPVLATLALLIVAGAIGRTPPPQGFPTPATGTQSRNRQPDPIRVVPLTTRPTADVTPANPGRPTTLHLVFFQSIGGRLGGAALLILSLGLLGPVCSTPLVIGRQFAAVWPRAPRWACSLIGAFGTWPLIATGLAGDLEFMFGLIGGLSAPAVGAIAADYSRCRGVWPGPRRGVNWPGLSAWAIGVIAAWMIAQWGQAYAWSRLAPSSVIGFATAFLTYRLLAALGLGTATIKIKDEVAPQVSS